MRLRATLIGVDPEQQIGGALVSRGKGIVFQLLRLDPAKSRYSNRMGFLAGRNCGPVDN